MAKVKTKQAKIVEALTAGKSLTVKKIRKMGLANPYDGIYKCREQGMFVVSVAKQIKGQTVTSYRLLTLEEEANVVLG
jgi:hypothetical protein